MDFRQLALDVVAAGQEASVRFADDPAYLRDQFVIDEIIGVLEDAISSPSSEDVYESEVYKALQDRYYQLGVELASAEDRIQDLRSDLGGAEDTIEALRSDLAAAEVSR